MRKLLPTLVVALLVAAVIAAASLTATAGAAKVNGATISVPTLNQTLADAVSSASFRCLLTQQGSVTGAGQPGTYSSRFAASELSLLVRRAQLADQVAKLHLRPSSLARSVASNQITAGLTPPQGGTCLASGAQVAASLPARYVQLLLGVQLDEDLLVAHLAGASLSPAGVEAYASAHPGVARLACVSVILAASKAAADGVVAALRAGASFAAQARAKSTDTQSAAHGGAIGCVYPGEFAASLQPVVSAAAVGVPSAPIAFGSNYVVLEVTSRSAGTPSGDALALVSASLPAEQAYMRRVGAADQVWVNSAYGRWALSSGAYQVVPPAGPLNANVLNPVALTPAGDLYK